MPTPQCIRSRLMQMPAVRRCGQCRGPWHVARCTAGSRAVTKDNTSYASLVLLATAFVFVWPFGLPAFLFYKLFKARVDILAEDEDVYAQYDFVLGDHKTEYCEFVATISLCLPRSCFV